MTRSSILLRASIPQMEDQKMAQKQNVVIKKHKPRKKTKPSKTNVPDAESRKFKKELIQNKECVQKAEFAKDARQRVIETILNENEITTLIQLESILADYGVEISRSVLTKDLREMRVLKNITESGQQVYKMPECQILNLKEYIASANLTTLILDTQEAGTIVVVNTTAGAANAVAIAIENTDDEHIVGVLAGYDTVFVACKTNENAQIVAKKIRAFGYVNV